MVSTSETGFARLGDILAIYCQEVTTSGREKKRREEKKKERGRVVGKAGIRIGRKRKF